MNPAFARYGEENLSWSAGDVKGFTRIMSNASRIFYSVNQEENQS
jgi:argininosuccinate synthase